MIDTPHYIRFTRALAIAATLALPACASESSSPGDSDDKTTGATGTDPAPGEPRCALPVGEPAAVVVPAKDAGPQPVADAGPAEPFDAGSASGPLAPPELPASFA